MSADGTDLPFDPRQGRFDPLSIWLSRALWLCAVLAGATLALPDAWSRYSGWALVSLLIAGPLLRTLWFALRWARRGDRRYSLVAAGVLCVVGTGVVLAALHISG